MKNCKYSILHHLSAICLTLLVLLPLTSLPVQAKNNTTKIHFISLHNDTDAILLESNGHYGMVDSGEDWDYPDGSNPAYPFRYGTTTSLGYEAQVIHYLERLGVKKLDFYLGTHSHSDHIGSADEILRHFKVDKLYISEYKDSYINTSSNVQTYDTNTPITPESPLWDNQYIYDNLITAAKEGGTEIITDLDLPENADKRNFDLGDMHIQVMNYERDRDEEGNRIPVASENDNALVVKVTAFDKVALLSSDLEPTDGDTIRITDQIVKELSPEVSPTVPDSTTPDTPAVSLPEGSSLDSVAEAEDAQTEKIILNVPSAADAVEEKLPVAEQKKVSLDLLKLPHHGLDYNNTTYFLTSLCPKTSILTGFLTRVTDNARMMQDLGDTKLFSTATDSAAVVSTFTSSGIDTNYVQLTPEWYTIDKELYYFNQNGRCLDAGVATIDNKQFLLNKKGSAIRNTWATFHNNDYYTNADGSLKTGWLLSDDKWYYFNNNGIMQKNMWIDNCYLADNGVWNPNQIKPTAGWKKNAQGWWYNYDNGNYAQNTWSLIDGKWYYFDESGYMKTNWIQVDSIWYYLAENGVMLTGWQQIGGQQYYLNTNGAMATSWQQINNNWYYFNNNGYMAIDWIVVDHTWYYLNASGIMQTNWNYIRGLWYYLYPNGSMATGWTSVSNTWYYLHPNGSMATGWIILDGTWYYLNASGAMQTSWLNLNGTWYYLNESGAMQTGWFGNYYLDPNDGHWIPNAFHEGWIQNATGWWYRYADGSYPHTTWKTINNTHYYFNNSGYCVTGWQQIDSATYYFNESGMMQTGWITLNNKKYYLNEQGILQIGWIESNNKKYYSDKNGVLVCNTTLTIGKDTYSFNELGEATYLPPAEDPLTSDNLPPAITTPTEPEIPS